MAEKDTVTGVVEAVIYQSPDGGYTVCELETDSGEPATVVGAMPTVFEGMRINAYGVWSVHQTYGKQFRCEYFEEVMPEETGDILRYLSAGNIKGIGPKTAIRIVERYGTETFDVMENHPEWLAEISGISKTKAAQIGENFREAAGARAVIMYCKNICSPAVSMEIYNKWGSSAVDRIKQNPYSLCRAIRGIGFRKADELAHSMGIPGDSTDRIEAGINYILEEEARKGGHTCLPRNLLVRFAADLLCVDPERILNTVNDMLARNKIECDPKPIDDDYRIYANRYYRAELAISKKLCQLEQLCPAVSRDDVGEFIAGLELTTGMDFAEMQKQAIGAALEHGVMILTGGPGTGKTTVTKALLQIFDSMGMECALAAPTGRAANRMSEATSHEARTLHRLLETAFAQKDGEDTLFMRDENNLLDEDVFIVDEVSMVDTLLMSAFLKAVKPGARVILIGDSDQLPSVGAGNVLADIIKCNRFCTVRLTEIYRQAEQSLIIENAHKINKGEMPIVRSVTDDFFIMGCHSDADVASTVVELCVKRLPAKYGEIGRGGVQVITPSKKGSAGTEELCRVLQSVLNPGEMGKNEILRGTTVFREGDRVMQVRNNYSIEWEKDGESGCGIFNGDVGVIEDIDSSAGEAVVNFDGRRAVYETSELEELELSYAITVHKSQGSEYPIVVIPVYDCAPMLQNRCLLYTAITRAAKLCILVARKDSLQRMVMSESVINRHTGLADKMLMQ